MSGQWVYIRRGSKPELFRVGFYAPDGTWQADSDYLDDSEGAAGRCNYLNGGTTLKPLVEDLLALIQEMRAGIR
jgi:hypothetical protein